METSYKAYKALLNKLSDINYSAAVLGWDQEVYMPTKGADRRAQQLSTLSGISHELFTAETTGTLLEALAKDASLNEEEQANVKETARAYKDSKKYPTEFVMLMSRTTSEAFQAWDKARKSNDFSVFAPFLQKLIDLKKHECKLLGYTEHPYDALLDQFERGMTCKQLDTLFDEVKRELVPLVKQIAACKQNEHAFLHLHFDKQKQWDFGIDLLKQMQYDFESGRQDVSSHPFTTSFSAEDVRVTTRINETDLSEMIWSCIHEGGHALYEQGLKADNYGLPSGEAVSLGIHESQSRMWENQVGRSLAYWKKNYPTLQGYFPEQLKTISVEDFYKAINVVQPSFIRTSADELTYHFHIIIRYELEKALIEGSLEMKDLPAAWNKKYKEYLGIDVPSDAMGVLQDIHWSHGGFGYFATYSLGSFYAAQFFAQAQKDIPGLEAQIEKGELSNLLQWLRTNIHQHGKRYNPNELCKRVTGEELRFSHFLAYAKNKFLPLYGIDNK